MCLKVCLFTIQDNKILLCYNQCCPSLDKLAFLYNFNFNFRYFWRLCKYSIFSYKFTTFLLSNLRISNKVWKIGSCDQLLTCCLSLFHLTAHYFLCLMAKRTITPSLVYLWVYMLNGKWVQTFQLHFTGELCNVLYSSCAKPLPTTVLPS